MSSFTGSDHTATVIKLEFATMIKRSIPAWMWLHKRFKTRPKGEKRS